MARNSLRKREKKGEMGAGEWLLTYSDMITLVLVFFVLLYSFSNLDVQKFRAFVTSFQGVGVLSFGPSAMQELAPQRGTQIETKGPEIGPEEMQQLLEAERILQVKATQVYEEVQSFLKEMGLEKEVGVRLEERGVALDIKERVLFDTGKADLKPEAINVLNKLTTLFTRLPYNITIEGHTDSRPINTLEFPSNWELSSARAARVVRYFTEQRGLDPKRFAAVGFGEFRPVAPNTSAENMAQNRRVVMAIHVKDIYASEVLPLEPKP